MRREGKNTPGSAAAATQALPGSDRREGVKVKVKAAQRSGSTCRAMQAVFFMHKREGGGGREGGGDTGTEVPHAAYPPPSLLSNYRLMFCNA